MKRFRKFLGIFIGLVFFVECLLSVAQIFKWKTNLKPYHVTFFLRPLVGVFVPDDFYPRTHKVEIVPWDYRTDRMQPGHYPQEGLPDFRVNAYGFRGKDFSLPKNPQTFRIVVLGASTVFGHEMADEDTYPALLENALQGKIFGRPVEVINAGMGSKSLYYTALHYFKEVDELQPDLIIFHNVKNSWFYDQDQNLFDYGDIALPKRKFSTQLRIFLVDHSLIARSFYKYFKEHRHYDLEPFRVAGKERTYNRTYFENLYAEVIAEMFLDAQERKVPFIFLLEPLNLEKDLGSFRENMSSLEIYSILEKKEIDEDEQSLLFSELLHNNIKALKAKYPGVIVVDPREALRDARTKNPQKTYFQDKIHLTGEGNRLIANLLAQTVAREIHSHD